MSTPKTARGRATRDRILAAAAGLIQRRGVGGTSIDDVLAASDAGKGQLYHYFGGKRGLVREVLAYQADRLFTDPPTPLDSWERIAAWLESILASQRSQGFSDGCPIGTLAAELAAQDSEIRLQLDRCFDTWREQLATGLSQMQQRGELSPEADPEALAAFVVATKQGGMLLAKTAQRGQPLELALRQALAHLKSYATHPDVGREKSRGS